MSLSEEIKNKLSPEQLVIAEKWEVERLERLKIMDLVDSGKLTLTEALDKMDIPERCEHGRSIMGTCIGCDEIERILRPELFLEEDE